MTEAIGPIFAAGFQTVTKDGYPLLFLPDANNDALQREGKPPVYHWLPNSVRLARKDNGDYKFSFLQFVGVQSEDSNVGVEGTQEVAGALCGFSTTSSPPPEVLKQAGDELVDRFRGSDDYYWGWRSPATPMIRPAASLTGDNTTERCKCGLSFCRLSVSKGSTVSPCLILSMFANTSSMSRGSVSMVRGLPKASRAG